MYVYLVQLFHPLNVYIVLVGVEVWTNGNPTNVDDYRRDHINPNHNNDHAFRIW